MNFISLFSGIGGFDLGFERAGLKCLAQVEINKHARGVLARHFPDALRYEDVKKVGKYNLPNARIIVGGFPCQDVSIAGRRKGIAGERSGLWFEFARIIEELNPRWVVIENVPGLLSSNEGRDFEVIISKLVQFGYGVCWRVLDSQYFGLAQRRKRLFVVGSLGDGCSAEILFEREGMCRDIEAQRKTRQTAPKLFASGAGTSRTASAGSESEFLVTAFMAGQGAKAGSVASSNYLSPTLKAGASGLNQVPSIANPLGAHHTVNYDLDTHTYIPTVFDWQSGGDVRHNISNKYTSALQGNQTPAVLQNGVRRLMPVECERLQGFPDGWTEGQSDNHRYMQCGNAVSVPVAEWIGSRINNAK